MKKFRIKSIYSVIIAIGILLAFSLSLGFSTKVVTACATGSEKVLSEAKIYSQASIADDFDDSSVIIIMDKNISAINKIYDENFFGDLKKHI